MPTAASGACVRDSCSRHASARFAAGTSEVRKTVSIIVAPRWRTWFAVAVGLADLHVRLHQAVDLTVRGLTGNPPQVQA
ncbi:hypothetical protein GCM10010400_30750 [Streptomyces aculeolatus]